jgi:hypothetical protein
MVVRPRKTNFGKFELESFFSPYFLHWWPSSYGAYVFVVQLRSSFLLMSTVLYCCVNKIKRLSNLKYSLVPDSLMGSAGSPVGSQVAAGVKRNRVQSHGDDDGEKWIG